MLEVMAKVKSKKKFNNWFNLWMQMATMWLYLEKLCFSFIPRLLKSGQVFFWGRGRIPIKTRDLIVFILGQSDSHVMVLWSFKSGFCWRSLTLKSSRNLFNASMKNLPVYVPWFTARNMSRAPMGNLHDIPINTPTKKPNHHMCEGRTKIYTKFGSICIKSL